jgi:hypothetical protein
MYEVICHVGECGSSWRYMPGGTCGTCSQRLVIYSPFPSSIQKMADMGRLRALQRTQFSFCSNKNDVETQRRLRTRFGTRWAPAQKSQTSSEVLTGRYSVGKKRERDASVRSPQDTEALRAATQRSPGKS